MLFYDFVKPEIIPNFIIEILNPKPQKVREAIVTKNSRDNVTVSLVVFKRNIKPPPPEQNLLPDHQQPVNVILPGADANDQRRPSGAEIKVGVSGGVVDLGGLIYF